MRATLFFLLLFPLASIGQNDYDMDEVARNAPMSRSISVEQLAAYFVKKIPDDRGRVRAIFTWITTNIRYLDTTTKSEIWATPEHLDRQRPEQVLRNQTAVCQGFANLFQALATAAGMNCHVVTGIVKNEDQEVMPVGHAWVAAEVQGVWRLFDPTWSLPTPGEGWQVKDKYFMTPPEMFVLNHLPDDPAWQLLEKPIRETEFRENKSDDLLRLVREESDAVFNFRDTLKLWIALDSVTRTFSAESRILQFNGSNQRILFSLGQSYWSLFFDLRAHLDSLADRSILQDTVIIDTAHFSYQLALMDKFHARARTLFDLVTEPKRIAHTEKFYSQKEVDAITSKLHGSMWTAVFENQYNSSNQEINEASLSMLKSISDAADKAYSRVPATVDCDKLGGICFEILHNLSLVHLQLAERYALFSQNLLADKNAHKYLTIIDLNNKNAKALFEKALEETRQLLLIPPPYAFIRDRFHIVQQGLFTITAIELRTRRVALSPQVETALSPSNRSGTNARMLTGKLKSIIDELTILSQNIEDAGGALNAEYIAVTLFNLHQEAFALKFNLSSLHFRAALDMYQNAYNNHTLKEESEKIAAQGKKALPWLREAGQSLDFLENSSRVSRSFIEQRTAQINTLSQSIREFLATL